MVIADEFAWAHLPKAGGTAAQAMFAAVPGLIAFQVPIDSNDKHAPFTAFEEGIEGKLRVMNIRRLPSWVLSYAHHKAAEGVWPDYSPLPMPTTDEMVESSEPDEVLGWMTTGERMPVDRWLRTESLADDVASFLVEVGIDASVARSASRSVPWEGKPYDHDIGRTFTDSQVRRMYELNPDWAAAERLAYGTAGEAARA